MNQPIASLESLSNELFHEIFDYLDGIHLYRAFSNLNHYFQELITAPFVLLKINSSRSSAESTSINQWKQIMKLNCHQIYSIDLEGSAYNKEFFTSVFLLDSSLNHLQSLYLWNFDLTTLMSILAQLSSLPRLSSLMISVDGTSINLADIYRLILSLPMLEYYKFYTCELDLPVSLPMANEQQVTQIKYLNIDHCCHFNELINILSYTPELRRLRLSDDSGGKFNPGVLPRITLTHLTTLSIHSYSVTFDQWEILIGHLRPPLKGLYFLTRSEDIDFLDSHRWERFLREYFPRLKRFSFHYHQSINKNQRLPIFPFQSNQFLSTFWIERKWFMEIELDDNEIIQIQSIIHLRCASE